MEVLVCVCTKLYQSTTRKSGRFGKMSRTRASKVLSTRVPSPIPTSVAAQEANGSSSGDWRNPNRRQSRATTLSTTSPGWIRASYRVMLCKQYKQRAQARTYSNNTLHNLGTEPLSKYLIPHLKYVLSGHLFDHLHAVLARVVFSVHPCLRVQQKIFI